MKRIDLIDRLDMVAPALTDDVPVLSHFWFRGTRLMANNEQIAISTSFTTPFKGAVPGKVLLELLRNTKVSEVELEQKDGHLHVKAGRSRLKLPMLPPESFSFDMPTAGKEQSVNIKGAACVEFITAIGDCMRSVTNNASLATDQLGVTLIPENGRLLLFSTDSVTMSHSSMVLPSGNGFRTKVILSGMFCRQMLRMCGDAKNISLRIAEDHSILTLANGDVLFGRLIFSETPVPYERIRGENFNPLEDAKKLVPIPVAMKSILDRACTICDSTKASTLVTVEAGKMRFYSKSAFGEVSDSMLVKGHPDVRVSFEPRLLKAGYGNFDRMLVSERSTVMVRGKNNQHLYMVSAKDS